MTKNIRIGVIYNTPAASKCGVSPVCGARGFGVDMARIACEALGVNCSFFWFGSSDFGDAFENGTGTGLVGAIQRGEYDTSLPVFTPTYRRSKAITFSSLCDARDVYLLTRAPEPSSQGVTWKIVLAFQWPIWVAYFILLFLTSLLVLLILRKQGSRKSSKHSARTIIEFSLGLIINELRSSLFRFDSIRVILTVWTLGAVVLSTAYTSFLFTDTVLTKRELPFTDFPTFVECLERKQCRLITPTKSLSSLQQLIAPGSQLGERIEAALRENPIIVTPPAEIPDAILRERKQYLVTLRAIDDLMYQVAGNRDCRYYTMDLRLSEINTFPLAKNSSLLRPLNRVAKVLREQGLEKAIFKRYNRSLCDEQWGKTPKSMSSSYSAYKLSSIYSTLLFYGLGVAAGFVAFLYELMMGYRNRNSGSAEMPGVGSAYFCHSCFGLNRNFMYH